MSDAVVLSAPLTPAMIAQHLSVSLVTVRRWIRDGQLRAVDVCVTQGRPTYRVLPESYRAFLRSRGLTLEEVERLTR